MTSDTPKPESKLSWVLRHVILPALLVVAFVSAISGILSYIDSDELEPIETSETPDVATDAQVVVEPQSEQPTVLPMAVHVNSYAPGREYPLSRWDIVDDPGGFVDAVFVNGELVGLDEIIAVKNGDIIHVTGWAGHRLLGMRFPEVLFSACGNVIGGVAVDIARPDVADSAHPNLLLSGWEANLFASDLPTCDAPEIAVWGRPPVGWTLRAVVGRWPYGLVATDDELPLSVIHEEPLIRPENVVEPVPVRLSIHHNDTYVYQCASKTCDGLGTLPQGHLYAVIVEDSGKWVLLQSAKVSGWILKTDYQVLP